MLSFPEFTIQIEALLAGVAELDVQAEQLERQVDRLDEQVATEARQQELRQQIQKN